MVLMALTYEKFMQKALILATKGSGNAKTNPLVGCVIVKNGRIIASGFHAQFGGPHAEVVALGKAGKRARGATLYVNLEPCVPFKGKKTGPCAKAIVLAGVRRVVVAMQDPNPKVTGKGMAYLGKNGVIVDVGLLREAAAGINLPYLKFAKTKKPYVVLKVAASLDGKITKRGAKYFSSKASLKFAHKLRSKADAILVGIGTVLADDPALTTRLVRGKDPLRVILDAKLRIPLNSKVLADRNVLIFCGNTGIGELKRKKLENLGFAVIPIKSKSGTLDWNSILKELGKRGVGRLLIEGGSSVIASALREGIVDRAYFIVVPEFFGEGVPLFASSLGRKISFKLISKKSLGRDILLEVEPA